MTMDSETGNGYTPLQSSEAITLAHELRRLGDAVLDTNQAVGGLAREMAEIKSDVKLLRREQAGVRRELPDLVEHRVDEVTGRHELKNIRSRDERILRVVTHVFVLVVGAAIGLGAAAVKWWILR